MDLRDEVADALREHLYQMTMNHPSSVVLTPEVWAGSCKWWAEASMAFFVAPENNELLVDLLESMCWCNIHDEGKFDHRGGCTCEKGVESTSESWQAPDVEKERTYGRYAVALSCLILFALGNLSSAGGGATFAAVVVAILCSSMLLGDFRDAITNSAWAQREFEWDKHYAETNDQ